MRVSPSACRPGAQTSAREQLRARETWLAVATELAGTLFVTAATCLTIVNVVPGDDSGGSRGGWQSSVRVCATRTLCTHTHAHTY
jgi:hypothetical protein